MDKDEANSLALELHGLNVELEALINERWAIDNRIRRLEVSIAKIARNISERL